MKKLVLTLSIILLLFTNNSSYAFEATAKQFSTACFAAADYLNRVDKNTEPNREARFGMAFMLGFRQGLIASEVFNNDNQDIGKDALCIPAATSNKELTIVVAEWLKNHPERLSNIALAEIVLALHKAFPCPQEK
jgi:hypothetical protein